MKHGFLLLPFLFGFELFQSPNRSVEAGNAHLKAGKAEQALAEYDKAVQSLPGDPGVHFDRGAALYALSRYDESVQEFLRATEAKTTPLKASAFYNLGNAFFKTEKYADAVAAYRRSLLLDPNDIRAKWNLELAQKKKKDEDQKKKNQQSKDDKNQNKDDKDKQQDKDKKDDQAKNDQKSDQKSDDKKDKPDDKQKPDDQKQGDQQDQAKNEEKKQQEQQKQDEKKQEQAKQEQAKKDQAKEAKEGKGDKADKAADMREIEAVLDSLERSPKNLEQERARLRAVRRQPPSKDW
jgi:Ca-activated chloride channel family protein